MATEHVNRLAPGANNPPDDLSILRDALLEETADLRTRRNELVDAVERAPDTIPDEFVAGKIADLIKLISACSKAADARRVARKDPFLASGRAVDAAYKAISDPLDKAKATVESRLTIYQRRKAEEERRRREEEARLAAVEAERQRKIAAEAAAAMQTQADLDDALTAAEIARQQQADAVAAQQAAQAKAAELSRSRGDLGAVASLRTFWDIADLDRHTVDLEALRPYIAYDALERAARAFVRAGGRTLKGCRIFENTSTQVR